MSDGLKLIEIFQAEAARDRILQELEDRGFTSDSEDCARGLGDAVMNIILEEFYKFSPESNDP